MSQQETVPPLAKGVAKYIRSKLNSDSFYQKLGMSRRMASSIKAYMSKEGKMGRPSYVYAGAVATGAIKPSQNTVEDQTRYGPIDFRKETKDIQYFLPAALSIQTEHTWMLMHDDIEDQSTKRRGVDAYHIAHDLDFGVNDGDAVRLLADNILSDARDLWGPETYLRMRDARAEMLRNTIFGQNLELEKRRQHLNETTIDDIIGERGILQNKSAYTNWTPFQYALILSDKSDSEIQTLEKPMKKITVGFQIMDDVLDLRMRQEEEKGEVDLEHQNFGKDYLGDIAEGKRTVPLILLYDIATPGEKVFLEKHIMNGPFDKRFSEPMGVDERKKVLKMINYYKILDVAEQMAKVHLEEGNKELTKKFNGPHLQEVINLNNFAVYRKF